MNFIKLITTTTTTTTTTIIIIIIIIIIHLFFCSQIYNIIKDRLALTPVCFCAKVIDVNSI